MILLHITPIAQGLPWAIEAIEFDNNLTITNYFTAKIALPFGYLPNPNYVVAVPENYVLSLMHEELTYISLGDKLAELLKKHDTLVFSNKESYTLFKKVCNMLLLPDLLVDKHVISFKAMVNVASTLRNIYPNNLKSLKQLGQYLNITEATLGKTTFNILTSLNKANARLVAYFFNKSHQNIKPLMRPIVKRELPTDRAINDSLGALSNTFGSLSLNFTLACTDDDIKPVLLVKKTLTSFIAIDLSFANVKDEFYLDTCQDPTNITTSIYDYAQKKHEEFIAKYIPGALITLEEPFLFSPQSTITKELYEYFGLNKEKLDNFIILLERFLNQDILYPLIEEYEKTDVISQDKLLKLYPNFKNINEKYNQVTAQRSFLMALSSSITSYTGKLRTLILDYLFRNDTNQDSYLLTLYKDIVAKREEEYKQEFMQMLEIAMSKASTEEHKKRLEDLVHYLDK